MADKPIKEEIREFIINTFMEKKRQLSDNCLLFQENILDSFSILELIAFIEKKYGFALSRSEVQIGNFQSLDKIVQFVQYKQTAAKSPGIKNE